MSTKSPGDRMMDLAAETIDGVPIAAVLVLEVLEEDNQIRLYTLPSSGLLPWRRLGMLGSALEDAKSDLRRQGDDDS